MGCEANVASRPATSPSPLRIHGSRHISLVASLLVISCFDICSDFIHFYLLFSLLEEQFASE